MRKNYLLKYRNAYHYLILLMLAITYIIEPLHSSICSRVNHLRSFSLCKSHSPLHITTTETHSEGANCSFMANSLR